MRQCVCSAKRTKNTHDKGRSDRTELPHPLSAQDVPSQPLSFQVITLDMGLLVAGTKYRGEFEERLKKLMEEIKQADNIILVIDEVHTLIGAGAAEGAIDAANILKPALARGELQVRKGEGAGTAAPWPPLSCLSLVE